MRRHNGTASKGNGSRTRYLACRAEPGMFRDEFLVHLGALNSAHSGERITVQLLVDRSELENLHGQPKRNRPVPGWLRVTLAQEVEGKAHVILPQPAQPVGESMWVDASEVKKDAGA